MADIDELQARLASALEKIAYRVENLPKAQSSDAAAMSDADAEALKEELEVERDTNARLSTQRERLTSRIERLEIRVHRTADRLNRIAAENARLEKVIAELQSQNRSLAEANANHQDAGSEIQADLLQQIESLQAARQADRTELDEILGDLAPMIEEVREDA